MSQDALLLCVHIFLRGLSPSLFVSLSSSPPAFYFPTGDLFCLFFFFSSCGIWDPIHGVHIVQLLSIPTDGPRQAEWVTVGALLPLPATIPLCAPCHTMMSWLLFVPGLPMDFSFPITHSLYLPSPPLLQPPPINPQSSTPFYPQPVTFSNSLASQ